MDDAWGCDVCDLSRILGIKLGIRSSREYVHIVDGPDVMMPYMVPYPSEEICTVLALGSGVSMRVPTLVVNRSR